MNTFSVGDDAGTRAAIYSRMQSAVMLCASIYSLLHTWGACPPGVPDKPTAIYLGKDEWEDLVFLCKMWGVKWSGESDYDPSRERAIFMGVPIYLVDAQSHLAVQ